MSFLKKSDKLNRLYKLNKSYKSDGSEKIDKSDDSEKIDKSERLDESKKFYDSIPIWTFTLILGIIFLVVGFNDGQLEDIYHKAVMICLECIGIG